MFESLQWPCSVSLEVDFFRFFERMCYTPTVSEMSSNFLRKQALPHFRLCHVGFVVQ